MPENEEKQNIIAEARAFADREVRPYAADFEAAEALPRQLIDKMAARGYLAASLPTRYGGLDLDPVTYGLFTEEIGKACSSTRGLITVHTSLVGETLVRWGTEAQKERWLPAMVKGEKIAAFGLTEPFIGTDAKNVQTTYQREGDTYLLNGRKKWISFGDIADLILVVAANEGNVSVFMVERSTPGLSTAPIKGLLGGRASHIAEIELKDVRVPAENLLGKEGSGFTYVVSTALDHGRYSIAWAGVAIAQEAPWSPTRGSGVNSARNSTTSS
jgi:alkylation response protein AidB-like acyl-CoA dehydrogenase